jgi:hypothetical protein
LDGPGARGPGSCLEFASARRARGDFRHLVLLAGSHLTCP